MSKIAIFASGSGSNAENIIRFFRTHPRIQVKLILCNNPGAGVIKRAEKHGIDCIVFNRDQYKKAGFLLNILEEYDINFIVLAGFLWLIPSEMVTAFPGAIVNIHPALLPKYGGKGMYGVRVHEAVIAGAEKESGISIHYVNEKYDEGNIIFQARCTVTKEDTAETLAQKIHQLEHAHFPQVIEDLLIKDEKK
jgi:phosphoribosylglycinamide formyltransferase-1